jgi:hypothetical protein
MGQNDVVGHVGWCCQAEENGTVGEYHGVTKLNYTGGSFTPFESLSETQVLQWCWDSFDKSEDKQIFESSALHELNSKKNVLNVVPKETLPWQ